MNQIIQLKKNKNIIAVLIIKTKGKMMLIVDKKETKKKEINLNIQQ